MKTAAALLLSLGLVACASAPPMPPAAGLFRDELFAAPSVPIVPAEAMAVSPAMRQYLAEKILSGPRFLDRKQQLIDALYRKDELLLEYDAAVTRTAAQAFDARSGNCLALVLMTAAFAREMGLSLRFQSVLGEDSWDRSGDIVVSVGHVNLTLSDRPPQNGIGIMDTGQLTIDFVAPRNPRALRMRVIQEHTVIAMFLNNRAVEALTQGQVDDAYWWTREAIAKDPELLSAYITLGVIYRNRQRPELAEQVLLRVAEREPGNTNAMSNRALVLRDLGRHAEADALVRELERLDPHPPFSYFNKGMAALRERRFEAARGLFTKEVDRAPYHHEFQFWLAITYLELHDAARATEHLTKAMEVSTTRKDHDLYAAKLGRLKALGPQ
ncbi:MAG: tetratricopeptide repeat protein [Burkholderiales bacterium]|nr:tetratricopeptide repeat protein [Burkholderiales bacterium]